jgi:C4-dicarboxylate-specific signal transduction histidine kinase
MRSILGPSTTVGKLLNLIMNAMESMTSGALMVRRLSIATRVTTAGCVEIAVSDRGGGIAPEAQRRLFQPFFTTKERRLGRGSRSVLQSSPLTAAG